MNLSVVVSTRDRAQDLRRLLDSLTRSRVSTGTTWEVVVADNGSSDDTSDVVAEFSRGSPVPVVGVFEPRRGKSHGLNRALAVARGEVAAFTDDDIIVSDDWIESIVAHFTRNPASVCVGGRVELHDARDAPVTIKLSHVAESYGLGDFQPDNIPILGCNMALRTALLREIGPFDPDIGPGSRIGVSEDLDLLYRVVRAGHRIDYRPSLVVSHNHGRRTPEQLRRLAEGYFNGRGAFYAKHALRRDGIALRYLYWEVLRLASPRSSGPAPILGRSRLDALRDLSTGVYRYIRWAERR